MTSFDPLRAAFLAAIMFFAVLGGVFYGVGIGFYHWWPYLHIRTLKDDLTFLYSDLMQGVDRLVVSSSAQSSESASPIQHADQFGDSVPHISVARPIDGYTIIVGTFDLGQIGHAALLLDPEGRVRHIWSLNEENVSAPNRREARFKFPHGFDVLPDGSVVFAFDGGVSLQRIDACSKPIWSQIGHYHHNVTISEDRSTVWTLIEFDPSEDAPRDQARRTGIQKLRISDGAILDTFTVRDVMDANPSSDLFGTRQYDEEEDGFQWDHDPLHSNDVEPLPSSMAAAFPMFEPGDLLLSFRSINLVTVVEPGTRRIKWFTTGYMRRQHDPDWEPDGTITIYDNNMHREPSRIIRVDPANPIEAKVVLDGGEIDFYSWVQGKHQMTRNGSAALVAIPRQGRIVEVGDDGRILFELLNTYEGAENSRLFVSQAMRLPRDFFKPGALEGC